MYKLVNHEIAEYIVEYDSKYSEGSYQFSGLIIKDTNGDIVSAYSISDDDEVNENEMNIFKELQTKIQNAVGNYFEGEDVEKFIITEFNLPVDGIEISIEAM